MDVAVELPGRQFGGYTLKIRRRWHLSPSEQLYRLIVLCYEATNREAGWDHLGAELAEALSASGCAAVVGSGKWDEELVQWSHGLPASGTGAWHPGRAAEQSARAVRRRLAVVTTAQGHFLIGTLCKRETAPHVFVATRPTDAPPFDEAEFDLLAEVLPHLARAHQLYRTMRNSEDMHGALTEIMDRLPEAIFLVDGDGKVLSSNGSARAISRQNDGLSVIGDHIILARPEEQASLRAVIADTATRPVAGGTQTLSLAEDVATMSVTRPSGRRAFPVVVTPVRCRSGTGRWPSAVAAVITKDIEQNASVLTPDLATAFKLTPGEARLAELIADGLGVQESAEALGITRNTARTHLKRIYAKAGVHSQADLVRLFSRGSIELRLTDVEDETGTP